jgi:hypothetical protein
VPLGLTLPFICAEVVVTSVAARVCTMGAGWEEVVNDPVAETPQSTPFLAQAWK